MSSVNSDVSEARLCMCFNSWSTLTRREILVRVGILFGIIIAIILIAVAVACTLGLGSTTAVPTPVPANGTTTTEDPLTTGMDPANSTTTEAASTFPTTTAPTPKTTINATTTPGAITITPSSTTTEPITSSTTLAPRSVPTKQPLPDHPYKMTASTLLSKVLAITPTYTQLVCDQGAPKMYQVKLVSGNYSCIGEASEFKIFAREHTAQLAAKELFNLTYYDPPITPVRPCFYAKEEKQ